MGPLHGRAVASPCVRPAVLPVDVNVQTGARAERPRVRPRVRPRADGPRRDGLHRSRAALRVCPLAKECPSRGLSVRAGAKAGAVRGLVPPAAGRTLRLVAGAAAPARRLDSEAVAALARDGLVEVEEGWFACLQHRAVDDDRRRLDRHAPARARGDGRRASEARAAVCPSFQVTSLTAQSGVYRAAGNRVDDVALAVGAVRERPDRGHLVAARRA